jgi:SagB-type dehydrogenase family enzyme
MKSTLFDVIGYGGAALLMASALYCQKGPESVPLETTNNTVQLPEPRRDSDFSLEKAMSQRRSVRDFGKRPLTLSEVSQLLWSAQGLNDPRGLRTAPSAGALYPLEIYIAVGAVKGLDPGIYKYRPREHDLLRTTEVDRRKDLQRSALNQESVGDAPLVMVFTAVYERTMIKYGDRAARYVAIEVGHAAQNVCLQAVALGLGAVTIGAFNDREVQRVTGSEQSERPLYLIPIGSP